MAGSLLQTLLAKVMGRELPIQQLSQVRKFIYLGLILVLFTASWAFRHYSVEPQAAELALREQDMGEVELSGSAIRLSLTGLRGLATCILWMNAIDKQKKNQWDELELLVKSVTKLQPHFTTPWLFQSWNLSYNVAVRCDLARDKYFYIARGIQLLADGERQNHNDPELRFAMGTYYQQKIMLADHKIPLQCLFEMSFIDPVHRDPAWLSQTDANGRPRLEAFCEANPRLVRRLREKLDCAKPAQLLRFLEDNKKLPSLYGERVEDEGDARHTTLKLNKEGPFPVLPQPEYDPDKPPVMEAVRDEGDAFAVAREWYAYAQLPLPKPDPENPGGHVKIDDPFHQRVPKHMSTTIFRDYPARAQSYVGERLEEEGWFEDYQGWVLPGWFADNKFQSGTPAEIGKGRPWARDAWRKAADRWHDFGEKTGLWLPEEEQRNLEVLAQKWFDFRGAKPEQGFMPPLRDQDRGKEQEAWFRAAVRVQDQKFYLHLTNFRHHYFRADVEALPETVAVRRRFFEAEQLRLQGRAQALDRYEKALTDWRDILDKHPDLRRDDFIQEETFETQLNYLQFFNDTARGRQYKQALFAEAVLGQAVAAAPGAALRAAAQAARPQGVSGPLLVGPFDVPDEKGEPRIDESVRERVLLRKGLKSMAAMGPPAGMQMPPGMQRPPGMGGPPQPLPPPPRPGVEQKP